MKLAISCLFISIVLAFAVRPASSTVPSSLDGALPEALAVDKGFTMDLVDEAITLPETVIVVDLRNPAKPTMRSGNAKTLRWTCESDFSKIATGGSVKRCEWLPVGGTVAQF